MKKLLMIFILTLAGWANAQTTEKIGYGLNPSLALPPIQFGQNAQGKFIGIPSFSLGADIGYKDIVTNNGESTVKYSLGMIVEGNLSQPDPSTPDSLLNGCIGLEAGFKGLNLTCVYQVVGDQMTGPGGSPILTSIHYDLTELLGNWNWFN